MASPRAGGNAPRRAPAAATAPAPAPASAPGEPIAIAIQPALVARTESSLVVRNSSFLSRDIDAQRARRVTETPTPPIDIALPAPLPEEAVVSPPVLVKNDAPVSQPKSIVASPPPVELKATSAVPYSEESSAAPRVPKRDSSVAREVSAKIDKLTLVAADAPESTDNCEPGLQSTKDQAEESYPSEEAAKPEESNGVGDKIKKFEKAAEDASVNAGRPSRPGSVRGRPRTERLGSDNSREDLPPPATPFKDNVHFDLGSAPPAERPPTVLERQQSLTRNASSASIGARWQRADSNSVDGTKPRAEQKIIKPEFKPMSSPVEVTIRSPSLGAKIADQFPSHGTAFRNVSPDPARARDSKFNDDVNTQNNIKMCKLKNKEKYSVSKGSSYFTRGSEEIWLVKKKDIEEIEERVLDSFRRAGGNVCMRSESMRPSSDSGQSVSFSHATMGRNKRQMYARSESLDPQWAGVRAQTLKRQSSVACTCGHDKKARAKSAGAETPPRPRSRSHGDENNQGHVLDKYETLV